MRRSLLIGAVSALLATPVSGQEFVTRLFEKATDISPFSAGD